MPIETWPKWLSQSQSLLSLNLCMVREIAPGLYLGGKDAYAENGLPFFEVTIHLDGTPRTAKPLADVELFYPIEDCKPFPVDVLQKLEPYLRYRPLLISCQAGMSRSASLGYLALRKMGLDHAEALRRVQTNNPIWPNATILGSVRDYYEKRR